MNTASSGESFSNRLLSPETLPGLESIGFSPVSPAYRKLNLSVAAITTLLFTGSVTAVRLQPFFSLPEALEDVYPFFASGGLLLGAIWLTYHWLADQRVGYALREQDVSLKRGLFFRKIICQPILRVQHVQLKRGPLERMAGLATLQVFSAGGAMHTFEVPGLTLERAEQIRQFILDHKDLSAR